MKCRSILLTQHMGSENVTSAESVLGKHEKTTARWMRRAATIGAGLTLAAGGAAVVATPAAAAPATCNVSVASNGKSVWGSCRTGEYFVMGTCVDNNGDTRGIAGETARNGQPSFAYCAEYEYAENARIVVL
jgi:hypothetical protein